MNRGWWVAIAIVACVAVAVFVALRVRRVLGKDVVKEPSTRSGSSAEQPGRSPLAFLVKTIDGQDLDLADFQGKVVLVVNVASRCGFTPQYAGLEAIYLKYKDQGFVILGFPANNFGGQEPGADDQIKSFCSLNYNVTFPMMAKISVAGGDIHPLYHFLTEKQTAGDFSGDIGWNFTKFLIDRSGQVMARFGSSTKPDDPKVTRAIEAALAAK